MGTACCCATKDDGVEVTAYAVADGIQQGEYFLEQTQKKYQWLGVENFGLEAGDRLRIH